MFKEYDSDYGRPKKRGGKSKSKAGSSSSKSKKKKKKRARENYDSHLEDETEEDEVRHSLRGVYNFYNITDLVVPLCCLGRKLQFQNVTGVFLNFARTLRSR